MHGLFRRKISDKIKTVTNQLPLERRGNDVLVSTLVPLQGQKLYFYTTISHHSDFPFLLQNP